MTEQTNKKVKKKDKEEQSLNNLGAVPTPGAARKRKQPRNENKAARLLRILNQ